jgi:hypothetical protein
LGVYLPEDDLNPYRNRYGDFTHLSRNGKYTFEWTPFLPAIEAWKNVRDHLQRALGDMAEAQGSEGFALNGLASRHAKMMGSLGEFTKEVQVSLEEAGGVIEVLEVAHRDYAAANEASLQQYQALMAITDGTTRTNTTQQASLDDVESGPMRPPTTTYRWRWATRPRHPSSWRRDRREPCR